MSGLFTTFNTAKSGLSVAQTTIDITSHNMANANTDGYSRQRAEIVTNTPLGGSVKGTSIQPGQLGTGAQVQAIERVRDSFLDYQYRTENSTLGRADVRNNTLYQIENIYNEPSDTGISTLMGKFFDAFQELSKQPQSTNARTVVTQQTVALTDALNKTYTDLENLKINSQESLKTSVVDINRTLNNINELNKQIKTAYASGQTPNDLLDSRDKYLDELSTKFGLTVEDGPYGTVSVKSADANGMASSNLVGASGSDPSARFSYMTSIERDPNQSNLTVITYYRNGDTSDEANMQTIRVAGLSDEDIENLKSSRILWADENGQATKGDGYPIDNNQIIQANELRAFTPSNGEISGNISVQADINNYMDQLDKLAMSLAFSVNTIHSGMTSIYSEDGTPNKDYMPFFLNGDVAQYNTKNEVSNIDTVLQNETKISAKNITINAEILNDVMKIKTKTHDNNFAYAADNNLDGESDGARALAIAQLVNTSFRIQDFGVTIKSREDLFRSSKGGTSISNNGMTIKNDTSGTTLASYFQDTINTLGIQAQDSERIVKNQETLLSGIETKKEANSGVSLDDETANLVQYQHAYSANAKIISTIDELLDVVVNGLKR